MTTLYLRKTPLFVLVIGGEASFVSGQKADVLHEARDAVVQYIADHRRQDLPIQLTEEDLRWMDIEVHELNGSTSQMALPYQEWVDDMWREWEQDRLEEPEREYKHFLELREKWEERFQLERARERAQQETS